MTQKANIIFIDNNLELHDHYKTLGEASGLSYKIFSNSKLGFQEIVKDGPELVFVELEMPDVDGLKIAIKFSEEKLFTNSSIFLLSKREIKDLELFSVKTLGFSEVIKKPFELKKFLRIVSAHISNPVTKAA